ncbi:hypothetical protein GE21DRAFT_6913 [Neurospora crassa]|uniref:Zn(2)-C6 fungal-type domain-containing protein n=1 Tax=Neurospora crassa (strain ATCC 24698 / 74-OR23-1A / CBS 708.71 / DSM 1257 / FGSC 987) TaxID=367110 RepID=Q7S1T3_NEUCR|nr:hypothetical protein NCU07745 [Neurospora crassa OR74A]EAA29302.2 hypothetical protein NCU07745 [Neurospora crassa OR74A]KHE85010.1 hypothetical protein GE21DRAFT_6913 [Neurospora crassa]|eukprot:XP_958538.2 hypothetical protein NCU07745 [Neurospora crassa OR74A]
MGHPNNTGYNASLFAAKPTSHVFHSTIPHAVGPTGADVRLNKRKREGDSAGYDRRPPSLIPSTSASLPGAQDVSYLFSDRGPILEEFYAYQHALQGALPEPGQFGPIHHSLADPTIRNNLSEACPALAPYSPVTQPHYFSQSAAVAPPPENVYSTYQSSISDFKVDDTPGGDSFRVPNTPGMGQKTDSYAQESVTFCQTLQSHTTLDISSFSSPHPDSVAMSSPCFSPHGHNYMTYVFQPQSQLNVYGASSNPVLSEPNPNSSRFPTPMDQTMGYGRVQVMRGSEVSRSIMAPTETSMFVPSTSAAGYPQDHIVEQQQRWVEVIKDREDRVVKTGLAGDSDFEERELVPVSTPLRGSYEDLSHTLTGSNMGLVGAGSSTRTENALRRGSVEKKKRGPLEEDKRKATCDTRSMGACIRCHNQRIRCHPNPQEPHNRDAPCKSCLQFSKDSKKTIHNIPCLRDKIIGIRIFRAGGLNLTKRFTHTQVVDVDVSDQLGSTRRVEMVQGLCNEPKVVVRLCKAPIVLEVRRFNPAPTDINERRYVANGYPAVQPLQPFCLVNVENAAAQFNQYINANALLGLEEAVEKSDGIVKRTFATIAEMCRSLTKTTEDKHSKNNIEARRQRDKRELLTNAVRLWFAIRHGIGSAWLDSSSDTLDMKPVYKDDYPLYGRVDVPRMIVAQFDSIRHERIYKILAPRVLKLYEKLITSSDMQNWFTIYLVTFLFLHQVSCISFDRYRRVRDNSGGRQQETRYGPIGPSPNSPSDFVESAFVEEVQHGGVVLLAYWQYFKRADLMRLDWDDIADTKLNTLEPEQAELLRWTVEQLKSVDPNTGKSKLDSIPKTPAQGCWEHELYWVSRMFDSTATRESPWSPPETFTRAKPSVGREYTPPRPSQSP